MAYSTLVAVLDTPTSAQQVTDMAFALASQFGGHVIGAHAEPMAMMPLVAPMEIPDPATIQALQDMAHAETLGCERIFRDMAERAGQSHEWRSFISGAGLHSSALMDSARTADLVIVAQGEDGVLSQSRAELEAILFDSGRPVLLVPHIHRQSQPIKRVLIAWNGSREAARATFDALPLLKGADSVEILTIDAPETPHQSADFAGAEIAATLARHGVRITLTPTNSHALSPALVIENRLADASIDLLVMGAYGHARWWEMLFGGTTRTLLASMTALTLLSR